MDLYDNPYTRGYFEYGEGSNYHSYGDDPGWAVTAQILRRYDPKLYPTLLELGSAKGYFLSAAHREGFKVVGIDISKHAVDSTVYDVEGRNHHWDATRLMDFPFPVDFDVVCSWEFFEHVEPENLLDVVADSIELVKPGGLYVHRIAIVDGNMDEDHDSTHVSMHHRGEWESMFDSFGLTHEPELEKQLQTAFRGRDWADRFFAWRRPEDEVL